MKKPKLDLEPYTAKEILKAITELDLGKGIEIFSLLAEYGKELNKLMAENARYVKK